MINVSHPGRYGDLLWAGPTIRALAAQHGPVRLHLPVDPANTTPMTAIAPLLQEQPYIAEVVVRQDWSIELEAPRRPVAPPLQPLDQYGNEYVHLGYREWPLLPLPFYTAALAGVQISLDPWIAAPRLFERQPSEDILLFHWSDRWFELKLGLTYYLTESARALPLTAWSLRTDPNTQRWMAYKHAGGATFTNLARQIASVSLVVTDCSAVHVLAAGIGTPCVVVEPEQDRHHFIFWPGSKQDEKGHWQQADNQLGKRIFPVIGGDGKPSFDARHTADLIREALARG